MSKQTGILIIGRFFAFLFNFILPVILVRIFNKQEFGLYRQLILMHIIFFPILQLGVSQSLYYFFPREEDKRNFLIQQSFFLLMLVGFLFFSILFVFKDIIASFFFHNPELAKTLILIGIFTGMMIPTSIFEILLIVEKRIKLASFVTFMSAVLRVILVLLFALFLKTIFSIIVGLIVFASIRLLFLAIYIYKRYKASLKKFNLIFLKQQLLYAIPFGLAVMIVTLNTTIDKFTITYLFSPAHYAVYSIGCYQIPVITITLNAVVSIILPQIVLFHKENKTSEILNLWHRAIRKMALISFPTFIFFLAFAKEFIIFLFTIEYASSTPIFRAILFIVLIDTTLYGVIVRAYGKTSYVFKSSVISFVAALAFIYPVCKYFGLPGAAIVVVSTHALLAILQLLKSKSLLHITLGQLLPWKILFKILAISIFCILLLIPIKYLHFLHPFIILVICSIIFSLLYLIFAWYLPLINNGEKQQIKEKVARMLFFWREKNLMNMLLAL